MRFALRSLLKSPGFTVIALITLALGIGVNTSMFSLIDTLLFRAAPFPEPDRLVMLERHTRQGKSNDFSEVEIRELRGRATGFTTDMAFTRDFSAVAEPGRPAERLNGILADAGLFTTLGIKPQIGRPSPPRKPSPARTRSYCSPTDSGSNATAAIPRSSAGSSASTATRTPSSA